MVGGAAQTEAQRWLEEVEDTSGAHINTRAIIAACHASKEKERRRRPRQR